MRYFKKIVGKRCYLSPTDISDALNWSQWLNITCEEAQAKLKNIHCDMDYYFSVIDLATNEAIGIVSFENINQLYRGCVINIVNPHEVDDSKGMMEEAISLGLDFAFNCLNMHSVALWVPENEQQKIRCLKRTGFKESIRRRKALLVEGKEWDILYFDILSNEYSSVYINNYLKEMELYPAE